MCVGGDISAEFPERASFASISYANKVWVMGGTSKSAAQIDEIYTSTFNGVANYIKSPSTFPWWPARANASTVVHNDVMYILGGSQPRSSDGTYKCLNDVWVYADSPGVAEYFLTPGAPRPQLARGESFSSYWLEVTREIPAPWPARWGAYAVSYNARIWLIGGNDCRTPYGNAFVDLWSSGDARIWRLDKPVAMWSGRNNIFAAIHLGALYVVASVQKRFYNTFVSVDGINYQMRENACALTHVDIVSVVGFQGYLMAFTIGCHNQLSFDQTAVPCSHPYAGPLENRIYSTRDGKTWSITMRPFDIDFFDQAVGKPYLWSSTSTGELRFDFKVIVHLDTLFLIGGVKLYAPLCVLPSLVSLFLLFDF